MKLSKIEKLKRFRTNLEKRDHDADKVIAHISEIDDLDEEKRNAHRERDNARSERDSANSEREEEERRLSSVRLEVGKAVATRDGQNAENAKAESELAAVQEKVKANADRIEFAYDIKLLYSDISKIHPLQLMELAEMLNMIARSETKPRSHLPHRLREH